MGDNAENNKRIAKNTIVLYMRMFFIMVISLYTSRIVLNTIGVEDYGIYNVVGGFVAMFSVFSNSISNAISRFITISIGTDNLQEQNEIFCTSINVMFITAIAIVFLLETIGLWFLNKHMQIPPERAFAANWVLQLSIFSFAINLICIPYNALIIAHERMTAFACISIFEVFSKLIWVICLQFTNYDKLIMWALCPLILTVAMRAIYGFYCKTHFPECHLRLYWNKNKTKDIGFFAGWTTFGEAAGVLKNEGTNILLNIFYGPLLNAAYGISTQVNNAVAQFSSSFITAVNPRIIKTYAQNDLDTSYNIVLKSSKFAFLLLLIISVPFICETEFILELWLKNVPLYSVSFTRLALIVSLIDFISYPLITLQRATGKVKKYQLVCGTIHLCNFPMSLYFLRCGYSPEVIFFIAIGLSIFNLFARLIMTKECIKINIRAFVTKVIIKIALVSIITFTTIILINKIAHPQEIISFILSLIISIASAFTIGINKNERKWIISFAKKFYTF